MVIRKSIKHFLCFHLLPALALWLGVALATKQVQSLELNQLTINQVIQQKIKDSGFSGVVLVSEQGREIYSFASNDMPKGMDTVFPIASITKQFAAAAVLLLEEKGKLNLSDSLCKHLQNCAEHWRKVTIKHLLNHSSGIADYTQDKAFHSERFEAVSRDEMLKYLKSLPTIFSPGSNQSYSNSGYYLLGMVIETISNQALADFMREAIFKPLSMSQTFLATGKQTADITGRRLSSGQLVNVSTPHMSRVFAAGAIFSTANDLLKWNQALYEGNIVSKHSLDLMMQDGGNGLGMGLALDQDAPNTTMVFHGGRLDGFTSELAYLPKFQTSIVVLSNTMSSASSQIRSFIAEQSLAEPESNEKSLIQSLQGLTGVYQMERKGINTNITQAQGELFAQLPGMPPMAMEKVSSTHYKAKQFDVSLHFNLDDNHYATSIWVKVRGRKVRGKKVSDQVVSKHAVAVKETILKAYVGAYKLAPGVEVDISYLSGQLYGQATGQQKIALYGLSDHRFFAKAVDLELEFFRDANNKVSHLTIYQGPVTQKAQRLH